jgi:serine/threonine-protein kinase
MGGLPSGAGALVGQRLGKYEIVALLALGGTAEIYLARIDGTAGFEKYVVVKCLHDHLAEDAEFVSMFLDEARLGAQLDHSNIVQTLALGEHEGRYYLVMEFIAGLSLALVGRRAHERVRGGKVPVPIVLNVPAQAAGGLHYAHTRMEGGLPLRLVHRDISPQNLVITHEGIVKVVDFGIAKADFRETHTRSGTVKGKFAYMSPEQCQAGEVDHRTDVFALGVIVWELLTGRRLFKRDSTYDTYRAVLECAVPPPSSINHELDPALDDIVMRALTRLADDRYPSAEAFGEAMIGYLHHRGKPSGAGEIAAFFEQCFAQELEDHVVRMRELIEGRNRSLADQKLLQWDASELDGSASVVEASDVDAILEESASMSRQALVAQAAQFGKQVGPVSPPLSRSMTVPERSPLRAPQPTAPVPAEDDFEGGLLTDAEAPRQEEPLEVPGDATRIEANPMASVAAMHTPTPTPKPAPLPGLPERPKPAPPPRKVLTPPGLRAGGAPLDPLPHERDGMMPIPTPPPSRPIPIPAIPAPPRFHNAPTMIAPPSPVPAATPAGTPRFADAPTVHDARTATPPGVSRFVDMPTVHASPEPQTGQTQMLGPEDLQEYTPGPHDLPTDIQPPRLAPSEATSLDLAVQPLPMPAHLIGLPSVQQVYPDNAHFQQVAQTAPRVIPPWMLAVMFVVVTGVVMGLVVLVARLAT